MTDNRPHRSQAWPLWWTAGLALAVVATVLASQDEAVVANVLFTVLAWAFLLPLLVGLAHHAGRAWAQTQPSRTRWVTALVALLPFER